VPTRSPDPWLVADLLVGRRLAVAQTFPVLAAIGAGHVVAISLIRRRLTLEAVAAIGAPESGADVLGFPVAAGCAVLEGLEHVPAPAHALVAVLAREALGVVVPVELGG